MDWQAILSDAAIVASVSGGIFAVLNVVKRLWKTLPWSWAQNTPGEVWYGLSVAMAIGVAFAVYWDNFFGPDASVKAGIATMSYSLLAGGGSNLLSNVTSTAGARLKASKEEARVRALQAKNGGANGTTAGRPSGTEPDGGSIPPASTGAVDTQLNTPEVSQAPPEPVSSGSAGTAPPHWPTAKLLKQLTPLTPAKYYIALEGDQLYEVEHGE